MEEAVWQIIKEVLQRPDVIIQEITDQREDQSIVEDEIGRTRALIKRLSDQERRLIRLFGMGQVTEEYVASEIEQVKKTRSTFEGNLARLEERQRKLNRLGGLSDQVRAFCAHVAQQLDGLDFEKKRFALKALQIRAVVGKDRTKLLGAIPTNLTTIERTSA